MFSYVARFFSALWAIIGALFALAANNDFAMKVDSDVPSAATDAEAGVNLCSTLYIAQVTAQPCHVELRPREHFEGPAVGESRDITSGSSLFSLGRLSTIEEVQEEDDIAIDDKDQEAGAEAMADIIRTTWGRMPAPLEDEMDGNNEDKGAPTYQSTTPEYEEYGYGFEGASHSCQSGAQCDDAENGYKSRISSSVGHYDFKMLLLTQAKEEEEEEEDSNQENIDALIKSQELTSASSRHSLGRLSTIEEVDEEEEVDTADQEVGASKAMEKNQVARMAWAGSNDDTELFYTEDKECEYYGIESGSMTLESPSLQVAQWRQLVHAAFDSDANSLFALSATHVTKIDAITFDDWSRSSSVSSPPTPTHESPDGGHTSPSSKAGRVRCNTSRQLLCSPLLTNASSPSLSATSSTSSLLATPPLGCSGFGYYPLALVMPSFLGSPELISGENETKSFIPRSSFVPDVFYDDNTEECANSAGSTAVVVAAAAVEVGADVLFPKISGSISFGELLGEYPTADKLFEGIPCLGSYETLYLKPTPSHGPESHVAVPVPVSVKPATTTIVSDLPPTCAISHATVPAVDCANSNWLEFPSADKLFEGIPSLGSFETLYLKPALPREPSIAFPVSMISSPDKPSVTTVGETIAYVRADPMPSSSSLPAIINVGFVDDSKSDRLEDGLIPAMVGYSVADRSGHEVSLTEWIFFCLLLLPSFTFSSFIASLL